MLRGGAGGEGGFGLAGGADRITDTIQRNEPYLVEHIEIVEMALMEYQFE